MSLFENDRYRWRETYFVLFHEDHRPTLVEVEGALHGLGKRYQIVDTKAASNGQFESLTLLSPADFAAMDVTFIDGEEVEAHVQELLKEFRTFSLSDDERSKLAHLPGCNARFDVFHFEQIPEDDRGAEEDDFLDPGALLIVLERLAKLCNGVGIDPQSGAVM